MTPPKVVVDRRGRPAPLVGSPERAWRSVGWFGLLLAAAGLSDFALAFYPTAFNTPEWEFGTVTVVFAGLPLVTMGFAFILASQLALANRRLLITVALVLALLGVIVLALLMLFWTDVPVALAASEGAVRIGIRKAIAKTTILGALFGAAYLAAAFGTLRYVLRQRH